ncbi:hypothetical protein [Massilia sp. S19_KUP03_FR1]|uniref:hypothetical protein n=1 Tax=Massilia sp. S19_KUP03_FR1 TaxID=3025503 RepID=UPI002FCCCB8C
MTSRAALALILTLAAPAFAQHGTWIDDQGKAIAPTEARRAVNGFAGHLLITSDADWRAKWNTPAATVPHFTQKTTPVALGEQVFLLIFFANAMLGADGKANLTCDLDVMQPDGTSVVHHADTPCWHGPLLGGPQNLYMATPEISFKHDPGDMAGKWTIAVTLKDKLRKTVLPLKTFFVLD